MTRRCEADFIMLLGMLAEAFPRAPVIGVICDNDSSCHTRHRPVFLPFPAAARAGLFSSWSGYGEDVSGRDRVSTVPISTR